MAGARVVVTGLGVLTPVGIGTEAFTAGLLSGRSGGVAIDDFDTAGWRSTIACRVADFDPARWLAHRQIKRLDRTGQLGVVAARLAVADAGLDPRALDEEARARVAVVTGTCAPMDWVWVAHEACFTKGPRSVPPTTVLATFPDAAAAQIAIEVGAGGPCLTVSTACSSSADALGYALLLLRAGRCDVVIAGGVEAPVVPSAMIAFGQARALSERNDDPQHASRPFSADRDGIVMGEGAALLVLEREADARARGARVYGELAGYGATCDAHHMTVPDPSGLPQRRALDQALRDADAGPGDVEWVNAHGTGTPLNDVTETRVLRALLGSRADAVPVSATKSMTGHALGASAAIEVAATLLCMREGQVHPTINLATPDPACDLDYVPHTARFHRVRLALCPSFGFGGHNAALVLRAP
jgi:3-oxoacyl-[acyl-carrier-protein] synthase II